MKLSDVFKSNVGVGGVLGLIWFRKRLPDYVCRFVEMVLMVTADHGPAVASTHNTIVSAPAGKDLISSLVRCCLSFIIHDRSKQVNIFLDFADKYLVSSLSARGLVVLC